MIQVSNVLVVITDLTRGKKISYLIFLSFEACIFVCKDLRFHFRWNKNSDWETLTAELDWKEIAEPIINLYTEATDGSCMEVKESALVWHHQDADPDFGQEAIGAFGKCSC